MPICFSTSAATCASAQIVGMVDAAEDDDLLAFVAGRRQVLLQLAVVLRPAGDLDADGARHRRAGHEQADIGLDQARAPRRPPPA